MAPDIYPNPLNKPEHCSIPQCNVFKEVFLFLLCASWNVASLSESVCYVIFPLSLALSRIETKQEVNGGKIRKDKIHLTFSLPSRKFLSRQIVYSPVWRFFLTVEKVPAKLTRFTWYNLYISSFHSEWTRFQPMIQLRVPCPWQPARLNTHRYVLPLCLHFSTFTFGRVMKIARTEKAFLNKWT